MLRSSVFPAPVLQRVYRINLDIKRDGYIVTLPVQVIIHIRSSSHRLSSFRGGSLSLADENDRSADDVIS